MTAAGFDAADSGETRPGWTRGEIDYLLRAFHAAPSVHNTHPARVVFGDHAVDLYELTGRRLVAHDPAGRDRRMSCGAALANV